MPAELAYAFSYTGRLKEPLTIGGPYGNRTVFEVIDGKVDGLGLGGEVRSGGADWMLIGADGWARLDVRAQITLSDGAAIYAYYHGFLEINEAVQAWLARDEMTSYGDHYFRTSPRFETGHPDYQWLTHTLFVGEGHFLPNRTVEYRVFKVT
ncbi:DUF3237 domain-containing protein [Sporichthya sp.]|uniref:DUF3237 domain-containing protein n=1 Tax=Sporichthya sp. TaxID=65475 RepID=UPI0017A069F1|nr:DUF3237 domain-containing protein [Sporichthya sp.]MBA3744482.1 DUF3237 domain-containing protein [Sporichthya sp.]